MAKAPAIPKYWEHFIANYVSHDSYWYFPKARAVNNIESIRDILKVLAGFEGQPWKDVKPKFLEALEDATLFERHAEEQTEADSLAMARILKITFDNLGFAWIDEDEKVSLTLAGKKFIETETPSEIFERQLWRYQISNPLWGGSKDVRQALFHSRLSISSLQFKIALWKKKEFQECNHPTRSITLLKFALRLLETTSTNLNPPCPSPLPSSRSAVIDLPLSFSSTRS